MTTLFSNPDPATPAAAQSSPIPSTDPFHQADLGDMPDAADEADAAEATPPAPVRPRRTSRPAARR